MIFHVTMELKCHVTFWVGPPYPDSAPYKVLGAVGFVNVETNLFDLTRDHVIHVSRDFVGVITLLSLGSIDLVKKEAKRFLFVK